MNIYYDIWLGVKWFFGDFCIKVATAPIGILKDTLDVCGITWKIFCLGVSVIVGIIILAIRYIKDRL